MALHSKIILGLVLGLILGIVSVFIGIGDFISNWVMPFGTIFVKMLKLVAVPLILVSLVSGISNLRDTAKLSRIGGKTFGIYIMTTISAIVLALILANTLQPGEYFPEEKTVELKEKYASDASMKISSAKGVKDSGPLQMMIDVVPDNFFYSASNNKNMLQIIFFAVLFGIALVLSSPKKTGPIKKAFDGLNEIIIKIVEIIMEYAPIGVFALLASLIVEAPNIDLLKSLLLYSVTLLAGLFIVIIVYLMIVKFFLRRNLKEFIDGILPAQLVAFSTSSSAATLPVTMDRVHNHLGVKKEVSSFVLPIGATINMDGTAVYQAVAAVFIAQAFGLELSLVDQLGIISTATLASIGAAAVPSAGIIVLVIVLAQAGIPEAGLALIFAVDRPLDMFRTVVNVTGDAMVSLIVSKFQKS